MSGESIDRATWAGTAVLAGGALGAVVAPGVLSFPYAILSIVAFAVGCVAFVWAYALAVGRSRAEVVSVPGVYFLSGSAPPRVRRRLLGAVGAQSAVVLVAAGLRPFTAVAFGVLAPVYGLGLAGLWGARHGEFAPRRRPGEGGGRRRGG